MKGLPASGKTTKTKELIEKMGNTIRINRDLIRTMLHFDKFDYKNEEITRSVAVEIARQAFDMGRNVIIDDTNLNQRTFDTWVGFTKGYNGLRNTNYTYEVIDMTDVAVEECVMRDAQRDNPVGGTVIKNMALQHGLCPQPDKGYVLCDIDGTIADCKHRLHFVKQTPKDWKGFFAHMSEDTVRKDTQKILVDYYNKMHTIIFISARPEDYKGVTLKWLEDNYLSFGWTLIMRSKGDKRPDTEVKQDIYNKYLKNYPIEVVIDDRPSVIQMWKKNGLKVIDVGNGEDF